MILAPFVRKAGGLQSTYGVEFPKIMCWIIKTIITRTRQNFFFCCIYYTIKNSKNQVYFYVKSLKYEFFIHRGNLAIFQEKMQKQFRIHRHHQ